MPHNTSLIAILCMGFVLAFVLGLIAQRLRLSPLVGYLLAGVIAGPYTPGFVADQTLAPQLAEIGVILLMFGVGLKFSLRELMEVRGIAVTGALLRMAIATAMGWALGRMLGWTHGAGILFGLALSIASTVVLLRTLEDRRMLDSMIGRTSIGWVVVEDLAMVLALVLVPAFAVTLGGVATTAAGETGLWTALLFTLGKAAAFVVLMLVVGRRVLPWVLERVAGTGSRELFTLCILAVAMGVAFGAATLFGVSFALGAFFAGMLLNESEFGHQAATDTLPLRDAFAVLFFVSVGMLFDPSILLERPLEVLATFGIIVIGKSVVVWGVVRAFKKSNLTALTIAASLAQIGEFSFVLASLGLSLQILPQDASDLILAGALLSIMVGPVLFKIIDRLHERHEKHLDAHPSESQPDDDYQIDPGIDGHAIIVGFGRVGSHLSMLLRERGVPLVVVEEDAETVERARKAGFSAVRGNVADERVMRDAAPQRAKLVVFAIPHTLEAGEAIARLKPLNPELTVLARAHSDAEVRHLLAHGADATVLAERELAHSLAEMVMATPPYRPARVDTHATPA